MVKLTEDMIVARTRVGDLASVKRLNCWGADLDDVSVLRRLENVEVIALSLNSIASLADFQHCKQLQELFLRKNHIPSLRELTWLKDLGKLKNLWLAENPCAERDGSYRQTVIHNLPQLEKLDDVKISSQERAEALRYGEDVDRGRDEDTPGRESQYSDSRRMSIEELEELRSEVGDSHPPHHLQDLQDMDRRYSAPDNQLQHHHHQSYEEDARLPDEDYQYQPQHQAAVYQRYQEAEDRVTAAQHHQTSSVYRAASVASSFREAASVRRPSVTSVTSVAPRPGPVAPYCPPEDTRSSMSEYRPHYPAYRPGRHSGPDLGRHYGPLQTRPNRCRNSNILSSILCLIKEIDGPSLEVVEMAVRCRMEELED